MCDPHCYTPWLPHVPVVHLPRAVPTATSGIKSPAGAPVRPSPGPSPTIAASVAQGRLAVEFPKSDLTRFITSALTEKNVPHAVTTANMVPVSSAPISMSAQQMLEQKVQSVINEQQQILNNQKANMSTVKTETTTSLSSNPVMSLRQPTAAAQGIPGSSEIIPSSVASSPQVALLATVKQQGASAPSQQINPQTSAVPTVSPVVNKIQQAGPNLTNPGSSGAAPAQKHAEAAKHLEAR